MAMHTDDDEALLRFHSRDPRFAGLVQLSSVEIVERAIEEWGLFKLASFILGTRAPDEKAAETLLAAYRARRIPAWFTALFLGELRVRGTYAVAREILLSAPGLLAESYAGVAMARLAGTDAEPDLRDILFDPDLHFRAREGAFYGLSSLGWLTGEHARSDLLALYTERRNHQKLRGLAREHLAELHDVSIAPEVMAAVREGRVIPRSAAWLLVELGITTETLIAWLGCGDEPERAVAIEAAYLMADAEQRFDDMGLATATRAALRAGADLQLRSARQNLDRYLADALGAETDDSQ